MLKTYDVHDFGAVGDGKSKDTVAIQAAIDACAASGGGQVFVSPGVYLSGTLWLKSRVELHLSHGAEILGSPDLADYNAGNAFPQNACWASEKMNGAHLIICLECCDIAITGGGRINGNSGAFFDRSRKEHKNWLIKGKDRPGQMVFFCECSDVRVENISLIDSTFWNLFLHGCENVLVRGVRIHNDFATPNGDGIDIDCCRNVIVEQCIIHSGDDSITIRADPKLLKHKRGGYAVATRAIEAERWPMPEESVKISENIVVSNCVLSSACNGIHVGVGDGEIRNCSFSNIVVHNSRWGIVVVSRYASPELGGGKGCEIKGISFSNITVDACSPFLIYTGPGSGAGISDLFFDNIRASGSVASYIAGSPETPIRNLYFNHLHLRMSGGAGNVILPQDIHVETWDRNHRSPSAFYLKHVNGLNFHESSITWSDLTAPWKYDMTGEYVILESDGLKSNGKEHGIQRSARNGKTVEAGAK